MRIRTRKFTSYLLKFFIDNGKKIILFLCPFFISLLCAFGPNNLTQPLNSGLRPPMNKLVV
ncbi:hypothetical protein Hanom_Chr12g01177351 [Helianthus anomalus]